MSKIIRFSFALLVLLVLSLPTATYAAEFTSGKNIDIARDRVLSGDYYVAGGTVTVNGTINGDLVVAGGSVVATGPVRGDVIIAGGTVTINSTVDDDVRVAGGQVTLDGVVKGDLLITGGTVVTNRDSVVEGDLLAAGSQVTVNGLVDGAVRLGGDRITLAGTTKGKTYIEAQTLTVDPAAKLADLSYSAQKEANLPVGAVSGAVEFTPREHLTYLTGQLSGLGLILGSLAATGTIISAYLIYQLAATIALLILGIVLAKAVPQFFVAVQERVYQRDLKPLGWGLLIYFITPVLVVLLALTVLGLPLALMLGGIVAFLYYCTTIFFGYIIGDRMLRNTARPKGHSIVAKVVFGVIIAQLIFTVLAFIPFMGPLLISLTKIFLLGAMVVVLRQQLRPSKVA